MPVDSPKSRKQEMRYKSWYVQLQNTFHFETVYDASRCELAVSVSYLVSQMPYIWLSVYGLFVDKDLIVLSSLSYYRYSQVTASTATLKPTRYARWLRWLCRSLHMQ